VAEWTIFGKREQQSPEPPRPVAVTFGTSANEQQWKRLLFAKYLTATGRLGRGDMEADGR
jgi:hypothetical protein